MEQKQTIEEAEAEKASAFAISQEDIDAVLLKGGIVFGGKHRIYEQFLKNESAAENAKFLKNEYGTGGAYPAIPDRRLDEWHDPKGIHISRGRISEPDASVTLTWSKAAKRIGELITAGRYMTPAEMEGYAEYRRQKNEAPAKMSDKETDPPKKEYALSLGDAVYLGAQEYELLALDGQTVRLSDPAFPLVDKELPRDEFDRKLAENPLNDHLLKTVENDTALERTKRLINEYCMEEFGQEADFSDLSHVDLAFSTTGDGEYTIEVSADLLKFLLVYKVDGETAVTLQCHDLDDLSEYLVNLDFDEMIALAETEFEKGREKEKLPRYDLGFGHLSNGVTVWNSLELQDGDYKIIAHISPDRTVTYYEDGLPEDVRAQIEEFAATSTMTISSTQDAPVFSVPPLVREPDVVPAEGSEPAYPPRELPYIFCEWSESAVFEDKTAYSLHEFDRLMKQADDEYIAGKETAMSKYGTWQKWYDADDPELNRFLGYDKVKFTLVMPDGRTFTERQDIGDGDGGVLDFLSQYDAYREIVPVLRETVSKEVSQPVSTHTETVAVYPAEQNNLPYDVVIETLNLDEPVQAPAAENFRITDDNLGVGTPGERFKNNVRAIRLLKKLEAEDRLATPEEQEVLSRYVGWGGLADCFDERHSKYAELKALLTDDEYAAARESTLTAFYTPPVVIRAVYQALENMDFRTGNILEIKTCYLIQRYAA